MMPSGWFAVRIIGFTALHVCRADNFLQSEWAPATSWEAADPSLEKNLISEIEAVLGGKQQHLTDSRLHELESALTPVFKALPKNEYGKLGHGSVRYMLHRYFVEAHGWFVDGAHNEGEAWNTSSPTQMLEFLDKPVLVQGLFEKRLGGRGFGLYEMAVLVATVENAVHDESRQKLQMLMQALNKSFTESISAAEADKLIQTYLVALMQKADLKTASPKFLALLRADIRNWYPTWPQTVEWLRGIRKNSTDNRQELTFADLSAVVIAIADIFGHYHGKHCGSLKSLLADLEEPGSVGCVRLADFYTRGLAGGDYWLFIESPDYLRQLGVLEESDPKNPRVVSANYVNNPSNCIQVSEYYLVCCHNQCDDILGGLERKIGAPTATPLDIVLALSEESGQMLPFPIRRQLHEVARQHDGRVPLHGRLFAQWLHQAFPQECPYPHLSGTRNPVWLEDYELETGKGCSLNETEMMAFIKNASTPAVSHRNATKIPGAGSCVPWTYEEELIVPELPIPSHLRIAPAEDPHVWRIGSFVALLGALSTAVLHLIRTFKSLLRFRPQSPLQKV